MVGKVACSSTCIFGVIGFLRPSQHTPTKKICYFQKKVYVTSQRSFQNWAQKMIFVKSGTCKFFNSGNFFSSNPDREARLTRRGDKIQRQKDREKVSVVKIRNPKILLQSHFKKEPTLLGPWKNSKTGKIEKNTTMIGFPITASLFIKKPHPSIYPPGRGVDRRVGVGFCFNQKI